MDAPSPEAACRQAIAEWRHPTELESFAENRHGYANSDGGFGVIYPEDLDEYDREVDKVHIPEGHLLVYGYAFVEPPGYEILILEDLYLGTLAQVLAELGLPNEAKRVSSLVKGSAA